LAWCSSFPEYHVAARIPATRSNLKLLVETKKRLYAEPLSIKFIRALLNQDSPQAESTLVIRPHPCVPRFHDFDADRALGQRFGCSRA